MTLDAPALRINGLDYRVVVEGEGPDVLLVHGFPDDHEVWRHQIPALVAAGYRVIAPDMRGCGLTEAPRQVSAYRIEHLVGDLVAILDALGVERVRLVGHDWGAVISWFLCYRHPERVSQYVALSVGHISAYTRAPLVQKAMGWYILFFQLRGLAEWVIQARGWAFMRWFGDRHPEIERWKSKLARPGRLTAAINWYRANLTLVLPTAHPKPALPVTGVWSSRDRYLCEAQMRDTEYWVRGLWRYVRLDGASHWLQLDAPQFVNELLVEAFRHVEQAESAARTTWHAPSDERLRTGPASPARQV
jgi:pimeloyl-ACP methyl ester carboxylesterase